MKEQGPPSGQNPEELTRNLNPNRLGERGDIFMAGPSRPEDPHGAEPGDTLEQMLGREDLPVGVRRVGRRRQAEDAGRAGLGIDIASIVNPALASEARSLDRMIADGIAGMDTLRAAYERIDRGTGPEAEKAALLNSIRDVVRLMDTEARSQQRGSSISERTGQARYTEDQLLSGPNARTARDEVFNSFFATADATPSQQFREAFNMFTVGMQYEHFLTFLREASSDLSNDLTTEQRAELKTDHMRFQKEHDVREALHNANYALYFPVKFEQLSESLQGFRSELGDIANRTTGVRQMMDLFEAALREDMAANNGYLRQEAVLDRTGASKSPEDGYVIKQVKERFKKMWAAGQIYSRDENGNPVAANGGEISNWEVDKIFSMARGMEVVSLRLLSLAAESKLPKGGISRFTSLWLQDLLQGYSGYRHMLTKYQITEEGLRPYLYNEDGIKKAIGIFGTWNPKAAKEMWEKFEHDPMSVLDDPQLNYLQRLNPNRCGDIFTWSSWRFDNKNADAPSAVQDFLRQGQGKMRERWIASGGQGEPPQGYLDEYGNWVGTGLRFEKLRGALANPGSDLEKEAEARNILERMATLQPHRLYLVSERIRARLHLNMEPEEVSAALFGLSKMESALYARREQLLSQGKTFDTIRLEDVEDVLENGAEKELVGKFRRAITADFSSNGNLYWKEFVTERESTHGYVLWTGDVPVDEFNMSILGDTGGYARRMRDNKAQADTLGLEMKMLGGLADIKSPEELVEKLHEIYEKISEYDAGKAKEAVAEKAIMLLKFYKEASFTGLPVGGPLARLLTRTSAAQLAFGKQAASWGPAEINIVLNRLKDKNMITGERFVELKEKLLADKLDIGIEVGSAIAQFMTLALAIYLLQQLLKSETSGSSH
jgi:hypothetical protein